jgi:hypothetical protein
VVNSSIWGLAGSITSLLTKSNLTWYHVQPSGYRLTIYRFVVIVWFSKYRWNIVIAFFLDNITRYLSNKHTHWKSLSVTKSAY